MSAKVISLAGRGGNANSWTLEDACQEVVKDWQGLPGVRAVLVVLSDEQPLRTYTVNANRAYRLALLDMAHHFCLGEAMEGDDA